MERGADFVPFDEGPQDHLSPPPRGDQPRRNNMANRDGPASNGQPNDVSSTRLYLGNIPKNATKEDVTQHFEKHGSEITEVKLMNGFGFIEFKDPLDARDVVPAFHGTTFMNERLVVQFARGSRRNDNMPHQERPQPRPRRTVFQVLITDLPEGSSWQDLKDFARAPGLDVVYSDVDRSGRGTVEFETASDMQAAVDKLNKADFKGHPVTVTANLQQERPRDRFRSRSPPRRGGGGYQPGPPGDYGYGRRPPRDFSPGRDYRRRTPPPPRYWDERDRFDRAPPPRGPPMEDYPPPRGRYADDAYGAPPPRRPYEDPYANGGGYGPPRNYGPPSPRRGYSPPMRHGHEGGGGGGGGYDRRPRW